MSTMGVLSSRKSWNTNASAVMVTAILLACASAAVFFGLYPHIAVRDADGFAYIIGARQLHYGMGYRSLIDEPLNHWPPGYSLILSLFPDEIVAAKIINYCSFGITVGLIYWLLRLATWSWQAALGLTLVLASGFLRLLANSAHADILTYAVFLVGIIAACKSKPSPLVAAITWGCLIPIKLISVVFLPPAAGADFLTGRRSFPDLLRSYVPGAVVTILFVLGILIFNRLTTGIWVPTSYGEVTLSGLVDEARSFAVSIPREFLFEWHGSISAPLPLSAFMICMLLAASCLSSLRADPALRWFLFYGLLCLLCSAALLCVKPYIPTVRLVGYGLIILFLGFRPAKWSDWPWLAYGVISVGVGVLNALTVNSLGSMDPHYAELARQSAVYVKRGEVIATNSFYILDLNANIPSAPVNDWRDAGGYNWLLWVTLPNFDPGSAAVTPLPRPGSEWCERQQLMGGILFRRCDSRNG